MDGIVSQAMRESEMSTVTEDDKTVWDTPSGYVLTCNKTLCMEETQVQVFTEGKRYRVESMHPIAIPAYVKVIDDQGELHMLDGSHLREWFNRKPRS